VKTIGIILVIIGIIGLVWGGITYVKDRDTADLGPLEVSVTDKDRIHIPPALSAIALVAGVVLIAVGVRRGDRY